MTDRQRVRQEAVRTARKMVSNSTHQDAIKGAERCYEEAKALGYPEEMVFWWEVIEQIEKT